MTVLRFSAALQRLSLAGLALALLISACGDRHLEIPITTDSSEAREAYIKGREYAENLRLNEARQFFQQAIAADSNFALAYLSLAQTQATTFEFFDAFSHAKARINRVSEGERLLIEATEAGINGQSQKQEDFLTRLTELFPRDKRAHMALGNYLFGQQAYQRAIVEYRKIKALDPNYAPPYNQSGYAHRFLGKYKEAEKAFKTYIELIPNDPNPYDSYAELLMKIGEFKESISSYRKALDLDSGFAPSYQGIAANYVHLGEHNKARKELEQLYSRATTDGVKRTAFLLTAYTWLDLGKLDRSLEELAKMTAIAVQSGDSGSVANDMQIVARVYLEQKDWANMQASLDRLLTTTEHSNLSEPAKRANRRVHKVGLAMMAIDQGEFDEAQRLTDEYWAEIETTGTRFQKMAGHTLSGRLAFAQENWTEAIAQYEQANSQNPENLYRLALAYQAAGMIDQAKASADTVAHWNQTLGLNYVLIREPAIRLYDSLQ